MGQARFRVNFILLVGLAVVVLVFALWANLLYHYKEHRQEVLHTWVSLELQIVQSNARFTQSWLETRVLEQGISLEQAEQEVFSMFVAPIQLLESGDAWIYNDDYVIYDQSSDFPEIYREHSMAEIFEMQSDLGASHYTDLIYGVENATEGTDWYIWLPEKGREYVAWTSINVLNDTWTIGLSTPESEILAFAGITTEFDRNLIGVGLMTILLGLAYAMVWNRFHRDQAQVQTLEKAIIERSIELEYSEKRYRTLVEQITAVTYIDATDEFSTTLFISPQVEKLTGYSVEEWKQNPDLWMDSIHPDDRERVRAEHLRTNKTGAPFFLDYRMITRGGRAIWVHDEAVLHDAGKSQPKVWHGIWHDITARVKMEEELRYLSTHDALTGVYNRAFFQAEMARQERGRVFPVSIIIGDVDRLKEVNDRMGHAVGDEVLRLVASVMMDCFRADDIIARTGGDEFAVLLPGTDFVAAEAIMARLAEALSFAEPQPDMPPLSVSLGSATGERGGSLERTLQQADDNMYHQKAARRAANSPAP